MTRVTIHRLDRQAQTGVVFFQGRASCCSSCNLGEPSFRWSIFMIHPIRSQRLLRTTCHTGLLLLVATVALAQSAGKISREVIDQTAVQGTALVLVGLNVPWRLESRLSDEALRTQRSAIASIQGDLLNHLDGRKYRLVRRYQEIPGIALEVGADALAELARLPIVTNVLLDRPSGSRDPGAETRSLCRAPPRPTSAAAKKCRPHFSPVRRATARCSCSRGCEPLGSTKTA